MRTLTFAAVAAAATLLAGQALASTVVLKDNFNTDGLLLNWSGDAVFTSPGSGTTDLIGTGFYDLQPGHGNYVDLDGSTGVAGQLMSAASFGPGTYTLRFLLAGNLRTDNVRTVTVSLGDFSQDLTPAADAPFTQYAYTFTTTTTGNLSFTQQGAGDNQGNLLDDVKLSTGAVPEPATWAMMLVGFGGLGAMLRRRRALAAVAA